jgi:MFS family permease
LALSLIAGGITALALARHLRHGPVILGGVVVGGLVFASLSHIANPAFSAAALAGVGLAGGMVISLVVAGIQARAPEALRGRVMGMYAITSQVVPAASGVAAGALTSAVGVTQAIALAGLGLALVVALAAWRMGALRGYSAKA